MSGMKIFLDLRKRTSLSLKNWFRLSRIVSCKSTTNNKKQQSWSILVQLLHFLRLFLLFCDILSHYKRKVSYCCCDIQVKMSQEEIGFCVREGDKHFNKFEFQEAKVFYNRSVDLFKLDNNRTSNPDLPLLVSIFRKLGTSSLYQEKWERESESKLKEFQHSLTVFSKSLDLARSDKEIHLENVQVHSMKHRHKSTLPVPEKMSVLSGSTCNCN